MFRRQPGDDDTMQTQRSASLLRRVDLGAWARRFASPTRRPTDALNVIDHRDAGAYRWYAAAALPMLVPARAFPLWGGRWRRSLAGERWCETLLVVRYPSHRVFMLMVTSPYYLLANRLRTRAVSRFELGFTEPLLAGRAIRGTEHVLGVHFDAADPRAALTAMQDALGAELGPAPPPPAPPPARRPPRGAARAALRYASAVYAPLDFLRDPRPDDPNPLRYASTALFALDAPERADALLADGRIARLLDIAPGASVQLYRRTGLREYLPGLGRSRRA
jgi:uncharacterized protein (DUF1330 family)